MGFEIPKSRFGFLNLCARALVQTGVGLVQTRDHTTERWRLIVRSAEPPKVQDGFRLFPPLFFLPYEDSTLLWESSGSLNVDHPFSQWFIAQSPKLRRTYPKLFLLLRQTLVARGMAAEKLIQSINAALDRLRSLDPGHPPPRAAYLKPEDLPS